MTVLTFLFYVSAAMLASVCIFTANNMSRHTCRCMKTCLIMLTFGLVCLVLSVHYELPRWTKTISTLPILWGVTGWLVFDRYRAHNDLNMVRDYIQDRLYYVRQWFIGR